MATEMNVTDEQVRLRIDLVISNNESMINVVTTSDLKSNKSSSSASKNESKGASSG